MVWTAASKRCLCRATSPFLSGETGRAAVPMAGQPSAVLLGAALAQWQARNMAAREPTRVHMRCSRSQGWTIALNTDLLSCGRACGRGSGRRGSGSAAGRVSGAVAGVGRGSQGGAPAWPCAGPAAAGVAVYRGGEVTAAGGRCAAHELVKGLDDNDLVGVLVCSPCTENDSGPCRLECQVHGMWLLDECR